MKVKHDACWICTRIVPMIVFGMYRFACGFGAFSNRHISVGHHWQSAHAINCGVGTTNSTILSHATQQVSRIFIRIKWKAMTEFRVALSPLTADHSSHHFIPFDGMNMCRSATTAFGQPIANSRSDAARAFCRHKTTNVVRRLYAHMTYAKHKMFYIWYFFSILRAGENWLRTWFARNFFAHKPIVWIWDAHECIAEIKSWIESANFV